MIKTYKQVAIWIKYELDVKQVYGKFDNQNAHNNINEILDKFGLFFLSNLDYILMIYILKSSRAGFEYY